jgi:hypothetical protein
MENCSGIEYTVPVMKINDLTRKFNIFNKRLARLHEKGKMQKLIQVQFSLIPDSFFDVEVEHDGMLTTVTYQKFTTDMGLLIKIDGDHALKAMINVKEEIPVFSARGHVNNVKEIEAFWAECNQSVCDHCHTSRARNNYFVIEDASGHLIKVGSSCVLDFLGHRPQELLSMMTLFSDMEADIEELGEVGNGHMSEKCKTIKQVLAHALFAIDTHGFVSVSKAEYERTCSTKDEVNRTLYMDTPPFNVDDYERKADKLLNEMKEYFKSDSFFEQEEISDFEMTVRNFTLSSHVETGRVGIVCAMPAFWYRKMNPIAKHVSQFQFNAKDKIEISLELVHIFSYDSQFGRQYIHKFVDQEHNVFVWKTGNSNAIGKYMVKGTVKEHSEYRDEKQTVLTRCKLTPVVSSD